MAIANSASIGVVNGITASGSPTIVSGSVVTFLLPRTQNVLVMGTLNAGSNCAAGSFNLLALYGDLNLTVIDNSTWPYAMLLGIGAGTINYLPVTLVAIVQGTPGSHTVQWQVNANTNGSVTVNNGNLDVFYLGN